MSGKNLPFLLVLLLFSGKASAFVTVRGLALEEGGKPVLLAGVEREGLFHLPPDTLRHFFKQVRQAGGKVVKTNAFCLVMGENPPIQENPEKLNENELAKLDRMVLLAREAGIKLVLSLASEKSPEGGIAYYAAWAGSRERESFYTDPKCLGWYQAYARSLLTRVNSLTGSSYSSEPAILAWDLVDSLSAGWREEGLENWVSSNARLVKSLAPRQAVVLTLAAPFGESCVPRKAIPEALDLVFLRSPSGKPCTTPSLLSRILGRPVAALCPASEALAWSSGAPGVLVHLEELLTEGNQLGFLETVFSNMASRAPALPSELFTGISASGTGKESPGGKGEARIKTTLSRPAWIVMRYGRKGWLDHATQPSPKAERAHSLVLRGLECGEKYWLQVKAVDGKGRTFYSRRFFFTPPRAKARPSR